MARKKEENAVLPSVIKVNGYDVTIRPMAGHEHDFSGAGGIYNWGQINLSLDSPPQLVAMCLVHELLHACFDHSGLRYKYQDVNGLDIEEEIVSSLGYTLTQIIGNEEAFVKFIQNVFKGKPVEVPPECMQIPIGGNWVMGDIPADMQIGFMPEMAKRKPRVLRKRAVK